MIEGKNVLALIPARGGSKGVPLKNLKEIGGRSLVCHAIVQAVESKYIDHVVVSTDSTEIASHAHGFGNSEVLIRSRADSSDETPASRVVEHAFENFPDYEWIVYLQPTSPFRSADDIDAAIELMIKRKSESCISVAKNPIPAQWLYEKDLSDRLFPCSPTEVIYQRQQASPTFIPNGAIYVISKSSFKRNMNLINVESVGFEMDELRSIDIDTEFDLLLARQIWNLSNQK
jgi:CMP-N-acetylneuraminic acid synthetase